MIGRLLQILKASEESPDATELADALWLASHMPQRRPRPRSDAATQPATRPMPGTTASPDPRSPQIPLAGLHLTEPEKAAESGALAGQAADIAGTLAGVPAIPAIPAVADIMRALRPLRTRVDGKTRGIIDEDATARNIADSGLWLPELLPDPERWLDLQLIVDDSSSMRIWRRTVAEFRALLVQLAAFRDIRTVTINTDEDTVIPLTRASAGRRLVLVVSDCVGRAWANGSALRSVETVQRSATVAILQVLPQRLWGGCGLSFVPVRISRDSSWTAPARVRDRRVDTARTSEADWKGVPIPVLELDARWLGPWAAMLACQSPEPIACMAVFTRSEPVPVRQYERLTAYDRVMLFRSAASPAALRLATYLAAAPLSLPVMRLVQHVMLPDSRPGDLAEVFLSGLLRRVADAGPATMEFDFQPEVRKILLSGLRRAEAVRVYRLVSAYIDERLGSAPQFPAVFGVSETEPAGRAARARAALTDPFGAVALTVLRSVGGQYREIADKLAADPRSFRVPGDSGIRVPSDSGIRVPSDSGIRVPSDSGISATVSMGGPAVPEETMVRPPALWRGVPPKNPNFIGRQELLLALRSQLSEAGITALVPIALRGLGGVGKTQAAVEYVHRFAADYDLICWVSGEIPAQLRNGLAAIAPELNIPAGGDLEMTLTAVCDALNRGVPYTRWLLVVDNATDPDALMPYLPQAGGHILITSRSQKWGGYASVYQVGEFTREESISLIQLRGSNISEADADRLADRLGDLPIAVEQAAAWQAETGMSVQRYLTLLDKQMSTMLAENPPEGYKLTIVAAWTLAFEDLQGHSPEAAALVQLCSFLGPDPIPYALLWSFRRAADLPPELENMLRDEFGFARAVRQAGQRALLKVDPGRQTLTEHRLVQAVLRERLDADQQAEMARLVWRMLVAANPGRPDDQRNWDMLATINDHMGPTGLIEYDDRAARGVIIDQIRFLYNRGDQWSSRELAEEVVRRWRESPGASDEQTLVACRLLGIARRELGMVEGALEINEDTLEKTRVVFGEEHEHSLVTANSYACDLRIIGDYASALQLDETLYAQHKAVFGENEEATFRSAHNLAIDMRLNGRHRDAYDIDLANLQRRREVLGDQRWETWSSAGAVGRDLRGLGEFAESARILEEAIPRCGALLGPDHPEVVRMRMDYASTLRRLGRFDQAIQVAEACVELNRRRLGDRHNYTLSVMATLAESLRLTGDTERALDIAGRSMAAAPATYGERHPLVSTCEHNYAVALRAVDENEQAYEMDQRVNERFHELLGERRRRTTSSDMSLARDLELNGDLAGAEDLLRRVRDTSTQLRGPRHPRTLFCAANLARLLRAAGKAGEADAITAQTIPALTEVLGAGHPELLMIKEGRFIEMEMEIPDR
jgi:tetratricopeptide (TPR) repeat protein